MRILGFEIICVSQAILDHPYQGFHISYFIFESISFLVMINIASCWHISSPFISLVLNINTPLWICFENSHPPPFPHPLNLIFQMAIFERGME
jgi:hypothetical protein